MYILKIYLQIFQGNIRSTLASIVTLGSVDLLSRVELRVDERMGEETCPRQKEK